jgi:hypothetical protein
VSNEAKLGSFYTEKSTPPWHSLELDELLLTLDPSCCLPTLGCPPPGVVGHHYSRSSSQAPRIAQSPRPPLHFETTLLGGKALVNVPQQIISSSPESPVALRVVPPQFQFGVVHGV